MFGPDERSLMPFLMRQRMAPGMIPGPVAPQQLTPGFRAPPTGGAPGIAPQQQGMPGMDPSAMAGLAGAMMRKGGLNPNGMPEDQNLGGSVAAIDALKPNADGTFTPPPMPTDIGSGGGGDMGWLGRMIGRLF